MACGPRRGCGGAGSGRAWTPPESWLRTGKEKGPTSGAHAVVRVREGGEGAELGWEKKVDRREGEGKTGRRGEMGRGERRKERRSWAEFWAAGEKEREREVGWAKSDREGERGFLFFFFQQRDSNKFKLNSNSKNSNSN